MTTKSRSTQSQQPDSSNESSRHPELKRKLAERLGELKKESGYTVEDFADRFDAKPNTVRDWLHARVLPRAESLRVIADHFTVTVDWLLGVEGVPKHPGQWRADAELSDALAKNISVKVADTLLCPVDWVSLDVERILIEATEHATKRCQEDVERIRQSSEEAWESMEHTSLMQELVEKLVAQSVPDVPGWETKYQKLIQFGQAAIMDIRRSEVAEKEGVWSGPVRLSRIPRPPKPHGVVGPRKLDVHRSKTATTRKLLREQSTLGSPSERRHQLKVIACLNNLVMSKEVLSWVAPDPQDGASPAASNTLEKAVRARKAVSTKRPLPKRHR